MLQKWGKGGSVIVIASALFVLSLFLPWVEVNFFVTISENGFQQEGYLVLILFAYPLYTALTNKPINAVGGLISSVLAAVFMIYFLTTKSVDFVGNAASSGMYVAIIATIVLVVGVFLKSKEA